MKIGDYVRTKQRGFQYPQIAQIKSMSKDSGYKNQYFIELDHNLLPDYKYCIYEEDIAKSSPNIIDLIEVGDYVNGYYVNKITDIDTGLPILCNFDLNTMRWTPLEEIDIWYSIITKEQFERCEYKV